VTWQANGLAPGGTALSRAPGPIPPLGPTPAGCPGGLRWRDERGSEAVEIVLILPALMLLIVVGLQLAMWGLAAHALSLGVAEGGAAARAVGSRSTAATVVTRDVGDIAGSLVGSLEVHVQALPDNFVSVSASGSVPSIVPGIHLRVAAVSAGPVQGFRASG